MLHKVRSGIFDFYIKYVRACNVRTAIRTYIVCTAPGIRYVLAYRSPGRDEITVLRDCEDQNE
jgi:hypothetical protein